MTKDEALLLFRKLRDDGNKVLCRGELFGVAFTVAGRVTEAEEGQVDIVGDEASVGLSLIADGVTFEYREPRNYPTIASELPDEQRTAMALVLEFPDRGRVSRREHIAVIELIPDRQS
jgi:hypothetical protein